MSEPSLMDQVRAAKAEIAAFLTELAVEKQVFASTRNQALSAIF